MLRDIASNESYAPGAPDLPCYNPPLAERMKRRLFNRRRTCMNEWLHLPLPSQHIPLC
jgi:hypothetical protein